MQGEWGSRFRLINKHTDAVLALGVVGLVLLLMIPLPPLLLDAFLCLSIVLSVMVLLLTVYVENALEFSAFPSALLFLTLLRLGLNVASTRMILTRGEAGDIIQTFGDFVIQGNEMVGIILFVLLTVINFIVVTKGAGRIAEVAARFTLEALPGKQMAIDSELTTGLISQAQAKEERKRIAAESEFYGSMDGASKFVKGDAIAGVVIILVNLLGGLAIGIGAKGMSWQTCWTTISRLTIGDGLVSQIPALLVSVGAAMMVTRSAGGSIGKVVPRQIFHQPKVLMMAGVLLLAISLIPGMPLWVMLPFSALLILIGFYQQKGKAKQNENPSPEQSVGSYLSAPLEVRLGYQAALLAQPLQDQLHEVRASVAAQLGIRMPSVHITDHLELSPTGWAILVRGVKVVNGREADLPLLTKQLTDTVLSHAHELITRQDVALLIQEAKGYDSAVVEELYPKKLSLGQILKVLQSLLKEHVPIRDFVSILEVLADHATGEKSDLESLTEEVRQRLSGKISEAIFGKSRIGYAITLDPKVEQMLTASKGTLRPKAIDQIAREMMLLHDNAKKKGIKAVVITAKGSRAELKKILEKRMPDLTVLSYKEVAADVELTSLGTVSNEVLI